MKLVMFTPGLRASAIGRMACIVVRELVAKGVDVVVVRCESEGYLKRTAHAFPATTIAWTDESVVAEAVNAADMVVYHVGDNFHFHEGALSWLDRSPGVVCLHDFFLGHLFMGWAMDRKDEARTILRSYYGEGADERFFEATKKHSFINEMAGVMPCTEWLCAKADAVVTHSSWGVQRVLDGCGGPVRTVPLAYEAASPAEKVIALDARLLGQFRILTVGHANANKRMESVIRAIGGSRQLRNTVVYRHVGYMNPPTLLLLSELASGLGVDFVSSGELDDASLEQAFGWADAVSCLRYPSLEAASASAIEAMLYGKPVVVSDGGFYQEIPDDCCTRIDNDDEVVSLRDALERLSSDAGLRTRQGERAREWATKTFRADAYAAELIDMHDASSEQRPMQKATHFFFDTLARWGGDSRWLSDPHVLEPMSVFDSTGP